MDESLRFKAVDDIFSGRRRGNQLMASGQGITVEEARLLWASRDMTEITWLDLDDNRLGDDGVRELSECAFLGNVQYLNLNHNGISDEGIKVLAKSPHLKKLKRLHLKDNPISGEGILALFNSETLESLSNFQLHEGWSCKKMEGWRYKSRD